MKKSLKLAALMLIGATLMTACGPKSDIPGFKKTKTGLHYKFDKMNKSAQQVQQGDVLVAEVTMKLDTTTLFTNMGNPQRMFRVSDPLFNGDLPEGLLMMHEGDEATFALEADSLVKLYGPNQMPPMYVEGKGMKLYYEIKLSSIVSEEEIAQEQANYMAEMEQRQQNEPESIAQYIAEKQITAKPDAEGLYVIVKKQGNGPKVATGKQVKINYTGRLLDGKVFDSSIESVAREAGIYNAQRPYEPLAYTVGQMGLIKGWERGIEGKAQGSVIELIIPSALGYGAKGAGDLIQPYTPLTFELEIVEVK